MQNQVCNVAQQQASQQKAAAPSLSDVLGTSAALPEAQSVKKGGSTFDTLERQRSDAMSRAPAILNPIPLTS